MQHKHSWVLLWEDPRMSNIIALTQMWCSQYDIILIPNGVWLIMNSRFRNKSKIFYQRSLVILEVTLSFIGPPFSSLLCELHSRSAVDWWLLLQVLSALLYSPLQLKAVKGRETTRLGAWISAIVVVESIAVHDHEYSTLMYLFLVPCSSGVFLTWTFPLPLPPLLPHMDLWFCLVFD